MAASEPVTPAGQPGVPTDGTNLHIFGHPSLRSPEGRGVVNGVPYGQQLDAEERTLRKHLRFRPGAANALRAATRRALGRG